MTLGTIATWDSRAAEAERALMASPDVMSYARTMQRARIQMGSADWKERLRWHLRLGPADWMVEAATNHFRVMTLAETVGTIHVDSGNFEYRA